MDVLANPVYINSLCVLVVFYCFNAAQQGEVSEVELLKDLLYVFQGIDGHIIRYDASSDHYLIDSKVTRGSRCMFRIDMMCRWAWLHLQESCVTSLQSWAGCFIKSIVTWNYGVETKRLVLLVR